MPIAQTTLESFTSLHLEGELGTRRRQVFVFISIHPNCSDREISEGLKLPINCVCGRRSELVKNKYIKQRSIKYDEKTNRNVMTWEVL